MKNYLFLVSQTYAFPILRPLQKAIRQRGDSVAWFVDNPACRKYLRQDETELLAASEVIEYDPAAVFTAGNHMYHFFPGVKVQVFHGFNIDKRPGRGDHYYIRGWFDLYCVNDATTTARFRELAAEYGSFRIAETGWTKLDSFLDADGRAPVPHNDPPVIIYSSTFTKWITSTPYLFEEIKRLVAERPWHWIITFHPKMDPEISARYRELGKYPNVTFYDGDNNVEVLRRADVMLCDSSSIIFEFLYMHKPVVTYKNTAPGNYLIDIDDPALLESSLERALSRPADLMEKIREKMDAVHPWRDGMSSVRVLEAVDEFAQTGYDGLKKKKISPVRRYKARKAVGYFKKPRK